MSSDGIYTIGDFSALTGLSEKALRLYDRRGLLPPASVDPGNGYRLYDEQQVEEGRLVAMLRAIDMPLADVAEVLSAGPGDRSRLVGRYWYQIERQLEESRETVRNLRGYMRESEHTMSELEEALEQGRTDGAFAAISRLAAIEDLGDAANAYVQAMKVAYWEDEDVALTTAIAYAGTSRLLAAAGAADPDAAHELRSSVKSMMYNLASFTWPGWDQPDLEVGASDAAAGLAAARTNLALAVDLDRGDLAISRAHWMLGAHLLTASRSGEGSAAFREAQRFAERAGAEAEVALAAAFEQLGRVADGAPGAEDDYDAAVMRLSAVEGGDGFVSQVVTARRVLAV